MLSNKRANVLMQILASILFLLVMLIGIRGRIEEKSPIKVGTAYFCNNPFLNQLGLNPNFTLIRSWLDKQNEGNVLYSFTSDRLAIENVRKYLHINSKYLHINSKDSIYPLLRNHNNKYSTDCHKNIVVVLMEGMSSANMGAQNDGVSMTPFLDSISKSGYYFENAYSAGIHTHNGIFSVLCSFPALYNQHSMKESKMLNYHGIGEAVKKIGYSTIYFTTHDGQFDNVEGFLKANDFERVVSTSDYPSEHIKTTMGVPDDYMFEYSIPILNELSALNKPFLSVFMTGSNHGPYYIPEYFNPKNVDIKKQAVEYSDYSLKKFIQLSSQQAWYKNTLFVFVSDHGAPINAIYDLSLDYNHIPLIFYQPEFIKNNKTYSKMAGQIDVFPSIMGLLNISFENHSLGINLFEEERPYIFFNADDKYGVIDSEWLLIIKRDNSVGLYRYKENNVNNYANNNADIVKKMKEYAASNLQAFQYMQRKRKI